GGLTVNRFCSSSLQAIAIAANYIINNGADVGIGGGVESITMAQRDSSPNPWVKEHYPGIYMVMGDTAEVVAKRYKIGREAQDRYALLSQQRTARAQREGFFKEELAPMHVTRGILDKKTGEIVGKEEWYCDKDECNRADATRAPGPQDRRHRRLGAERGLRLAGRLLSRPARPRPGEAQPERRLDLDRPPVRHDRLAHGGHDRQRDAALEGALRRRDHVHWRRPGRRGALRGLQLVS